MAVFETMTVRKRAEAALRQSEECLRTIFEQAAVGLAQIDSHSGRFLRVNQKLCDITGYSAEELCERTFGDISHPDDIALQQERHGQLISGQRQDLTLEKRYLHKAGHVVWVKVSAAHSPDTGQFISVVEDISQARLADAALRVQGSALRAAANGVMITDCQGTIRQVNPACCALTGYEETELVGQNARILQSGQQPLSFYQDLWGTIRQGRVWRGELVNRRKDGSTYHEEMTITSVPDGRGGISHFVAIKQDISQRKAAQEALGRAEERARLALEAAEQGMWRHDLEAGVVEMDARAMWHFDCPSTTTTVEEILSHLHPADRDRVIRVRQEALASGKTGRARMEARVLLATGQVRWLDLHVRFVFEQSGAPAYVIGASRDISLAKLSEAALRASEERYRVLVDSLDDVVFATDPAGNISFVNAAVEHFGHRPLGVIGQPLTHLFHPDDHQAVADLCQRRRSGPVQGTFEWRVPVSAGKVRTVRAVVRSQIRGLSGVLIDLTRQRETEEQLRAAQKMEAIGRLAGGVAHDFNNLLSVILSATEMALTEAAPNSQLSSDLDEVASAARRAESLTRQLLAFSRRQVLVPEVIDLNALVRGVERMLCRVIGEDLSLWVETDESLFATTADRGQMEQVLLNLVINARDAMPGGGRVRIATANARLDATSAAPLGLNAGDYVTLEVADSGCGMDEATRARIFEPFFTTKSAAKGTGLGLATVYGIVHQSGGAITVASAPEEGSSFTIYLPRCSSPATDIAANLPRGTATGHETVLIVEDESALRLLMARLLSTAGYRVLTATHAGEALPLCQAHGSELDLILMDVVMPGLSGPELAKVVAPLCPSAHVIFMSGYTDEALEPHGVLARDFLRKPFDGHTLTQRIRAVLDGRPPTPPAPARPSPNR